MTIASPGARAPHAEPLKRAKTLKNYSELPNWFGLENYQEARKLGAAGWYEQLCLRESCLYWVSEGILHEPVNLLLDAIRQTPIIDLKDYRLILFFGGGKLEVIKSRSPADSETLRGVHALTVRELFWTEAHMRRGRRTYATRFAEQVFDREISDLSSILYKCKPWIDEPVYDSMKENWPANSKAVMVNLALPDRVLLDHFTHFLESERKRTTLERTTKRYRESTFADWIGFGVLPYLDLVIWSKENDVRIPNRVLADAIFPEGLGGEEVVRKTTAPLANRLIRRKSMEILEAKAAIELSEKYHGAKLPET